MPVLLIYKKKIEEYFYVEYLKDSRKNWDWLCFLLFMQWVNTNLLSFTCFKKNAGHCWRSRDELIRDVLLWIPTHGRAKAGRPARTYIQQLCEDTGCCPEDLPRAMNDREEWRERVRDIRAASTIWWWWWRKSGKIISTDFLFSLETEKIIFE